MHYGNHVTFNQPQSFFKVVDISAQLGKLMPEMKKKNISRESNALVSRLIIDVIPFSKNQEIFTEINRLLAENCDCFFSRN